MTTVLVVDDLQSEIDLISSYLIAEGYAVTSAIDGKDALLKISDCKPDVILSDWMMPEMGGLELCRKLQKNPDTSDIPIIACTVKNRDVDRKWATKQGVKVYLTKPYTRDQIVDAVKSVVR